MTVLSPKRKFKRLILQSLSAVWIGKDSGIAYLVLFHPAAETRAELEKHSSMNEGGHVRSPTVKITTKDQSGYDKCKLTCNVVSAKYRKANDTMQIHVFNDIDTSDSMEC
jgi:hypothetical protein